MSVVINNPHSNLSILNRRPAHLNNHRARASSLSSLINAFGARRVVFLCGGIASSADNGFNVYDPEAMRCMAWRALAVAALCER